MDPGFWHARWRSNRIGFHNQNVHPLLVNHWPALMADAGEPATILAPLCGKSNDLTWMREQGSQVIGVELSELAAVAYFEEQSLRPMAHRVGGARLYHAQGVGILVEDWMNVDQAVIADACSAMEVSVPRAVYDRAAVVALPPDMRLGYMERLHELAADSSWLVITVEYDQSLRGGPPFSIHEQEVRQLHAGRDVSRLSEVDSPLKDLIVKEAAYLSVPRSDRGREDRGPAG